MKVLIFGPSGSGKTHVSRALHGSGINAFDADDVSGLSAWYNKHGTKVAAPANADEAVLNHYSFLWSRKFLKSYLDQFTEVYLFGGSGNVFDVLDLFDKIYFLKVEPGVQRERLLHRSAGKPAMDLQDDKVVIWGHWLEEEARKRGISFLNASLTPEQIFDTLCQ